MSPASSAPEGATGGLRLAHLADRYSLSGRLIRNRRVNDALTQAGWMPAHLRVDEREVTMLRWDASAGEGERLDAFERRAEEVGRGP